MALQPFHAFWDREQGHVAVLARDQPRGKQSAGRSLPSLYRVFLKAPDQEDERFLGIFNSAAPATRWMPAPWVLVPVGPLDTFELRLEADGRGRNASRSTLIFDANLRFNFDRALLSSERRVFLTYNEIWRQEAEESELTNRRYVSIVDRAPPERTLGAFTEKIEALSRQRGEELLMMLAYHVRNDRYGPMSKLWPAQDAQINIQQEVLPREYQSREDLARLRSKIEQQRGIELDDSPEMDTSVFNYMLTDAKFYNQPVLTVRLGSTFEEAERLKRSITFFHIKENVFAVEKERTKGGSSSKAARLRKLPEQQRDSNQDLSSDYRRQSHTLHPCAEWRLEEDDTGLLLRWPCEDIAMGDVVGVFVASEVQLLLNGADIFSNGQHHQPSLARAKCMYFRFLSDQLVPMLPEKLDNHYASVMNDFTRRMEAALAEGRFDDEPRSPARIDELAIESGRGRPPQSLFEVLYDAWDDERRTLASPRRGGTRAHRQQTVMQTIEFDQFRQWPSLMHALARTPSLRERVDRQAEWTRQVDMQPSFLLAALALSGAPAKAMDWASKLAEGRVQALAWDILAHDVEAINLCANANLGLSPAAAAIANVASLKDTIGLLRDHSSLDRTLLSLGDLEDIAKKTEFESIATGIRERRNLKYESLEKARQLINQAERQLEDEYTLADEVVALCPKLPDGQAAFNPARFKLEPASKDAKAKLKSDIKRRLDIRILNFEDRVDAVAKVDLLETGAALRPLLMWLDNREPDQEARLLICDVAAALIEWSSRAGVAAQAVASESAKGGRLSPDRAKKWWDDWTIALKTWSQLPDDVGIDRLAAVAPSADGNEISAALQPIAASVSQLRRRVREISRESVRGAASDLQRGTLDELEALDRLAEIAFATATCRSLKALALSDIKNYYDQYLRTELALLKGDRGSIEGVYDSLDAIQVQWDELGRCLAPEQGPRGLGPALEAVEALMAELRKLPLAAPNRRPLPRLEMTPAPSLESIEQRDSRTLSS